MSPSQQLRTSIIIFAVGRNDLCDRLCADLNVICDDAGQEPRKRYGGCFYSRGRERGALTISQHRFAEDVGMQGCNLCCFGSECTN